MFRKVALRYDLVCLALAAIGASGLGSGTARADHDSFEYTGRYYEFPGERQIISALANLERARCSPTLAAGYTRRAAWETSYALSRVCDRQTHFYLSGALDHMDAFVCHGDPCDLNDAARLLHKGLLAEQCHYGHGHAPVAAPAVPYGGYRPAPAIGYSYGRGRSSVYIGGRHGSIQFNF
jgi:hypothetical protein